MLERTAHNPVASVMPEVRTGRHGEMVTGTGFRHEHEPQPRVGYSHAFMRIVQGERPNTKCILP